MAAIALPIPFPSVQRTTLYDVIDYTDALFETLESTPEDDLEARAQCEAAIAEALPLEREKVDAITGYWGHCEAQVKYAAEEIKRLQARKKAFENRVERLKSYIGHTMTLTGKKKLEGRTSGFRFHPCPVSVDITDLESIPEIYRNYTWTPDKNGMRIDMQDGVEIPGARLITDKKSVVRT